MSLWSIPGEPTRDLMVESYRRLTAGSPNAEALRDARQVPESGQSGRIRPARRIRLDGYEKTPRGAVWASPAE